MRKSYIKGYPFAVSVEPTTSCNLRCPQCPSGLRQFTRPIGMLENGSFIKFIKEIKRYVFSINFYFQGEPYLNPNFLEMVKTAKTEKLYTITSTNAHYLNDEISKQTIESGLDELIISIDGTTQDVYSQYRKGGSLEKVIEGAKNIIKWKRALKSSTPLIVFQFVVFKQNEHQIESVKELGKRIGANKVRIKTAQIYDFESNEEIIPEAAKYSRYIKNSANKWQIKNPLLNQCWRMWKGSVITWDGKLVPCCFDKDAKYQIGDLQAENFKTIWNSKAYNAFRDKILIGRDQIDICTNCTEGTKVWAD